MSAETTTLVSQTARSGRSVRTTGGSDRFGYVCLGDAQGLQFAANGISRTDTGWGQDQPAVLHFNLQISRRPECLNDTLRTE
jgi:hypothetical protein